MTSSRFDPDSTSKTLNLSLLRFNERSGSENLAYESRNYRFKIVVSSVRVCLVSRHNTMHMFKRCKNSEHTCKLFFNILFKNKIQKTLQSNVRKKNLEPYKKNCNFYHDYSYNKL